MKSKSSAQAKESHAKGFTLVETLVAITILAVVITTTTTLLMSLTNANRDHILSMRAQWLAQEGIEAIRNMRDSNWLQNQAWNRGEILWGDNFASSEGEYTVELKTGLMEGDSPFTLTRLVGAFSSGSSKLYLSKLSDGGIKYTHSPSGLYGANTLTPFERILEIEKINDDSMRIESRVNYQAGKKEKTVSLFTELTNWK